MDLSADSGKLPTNAATGEFEPELSLPRGCRRTEAEGSISLQVLEFKNLLLEAVEELLIRRDAEARYEEQISRIVVKKQELEWQKESLQHRIETMANQHEEALNHLKKQGKRELTAELKEKEINSMKEELKSLQRFKYSLEKKLSELEQKLSFQSQSKDSHLNQLGEVEKRFGALSRQCATLKQAHEKLEKNVDEAMRVNKKLTSVNMKLETTMCSLKQELQVLRNKMTKTKVSSLACSENNINLAREQHVQQLQQRLLMETEMNKKLQEDNSTEQAERQEILRALRSAQKLLLSQTEAVSRVELELETYREEYQALKREHEAMQEKCGATEDRMAGLMEEHATSKAAWEREKTVLQEIAQSHQQDLLHQKHIDLECALDLAKENEIIMAQDKQFWSESVDIPEEGWDMNANDQPMESMTDMEDVDMTGETSEVGFHMDTAYVDPSLYQIKDCSQRHSVSSPLFPVVDGTQGDEPLSESNPSSEMAELQCFLAPSQTQDPDGLLVTEPVDKFTATGGTGGSWQDQPSQRRESSNTSILSTSQLGTSDLLVSPLTLPVTTERQTDNLNTHKFKPRTESTDNNLCTSDLALLTGGHGGARVVVSISGPKNRSVYGAIDLLAEGGSDGQGKECNEGEEGRKYHFEEERTNVEEDGRKDENGKERQRIASEASDGSSKNRGDAEQQTTVDAVMDESRKDETETRNPPAEGERREDGEEEEEGGETDREREGGRSVSRAAKEIPSQTSVDSKHRDGESNVPQAVDLMENGEPSVSVSHPSNHSHSLGQIGTEISDDTSHLKKVCLTEEQHGLQALAYGDILTFAPHDESLSLPTAVQIGSQETAKSVSQKTCTAAGSTSLSSELTLNQSLNGALQDCTTTSASRSDCIVNTTQSEEPTNPIDRTTVSGEIEDTCGKYFSDERVIVISQPPTGNTTLKEAKAVYEDGVDIGYQDSPLCKDSILSQYVIEQEPSTAPPEDEISGCDQHMKNNNMDADVPLFTPDEMNFDMPDPSSHELDTTLQEIDSTESTENTLAEELFGDMGYSLHGNKNYRSSFDWARAQKSKVNSRDRSDASGWHGLNQGRLGESGIFAQPITQGSSVSESSPRGPAGFHGQPSPFAIPMFLRGKQNKEPLVISRVSDLLNAPSVSALPASIKRDQHGEWKAVRNTFRETAKPETESKASLSTDSAPSPSSSSPVSRKSWQTAGGRTQTSGPGPCPAPGSGSTSQGSDDQHSSLRVQISRMEELLFAEGLCPPKRRRSDNYI